MARMSFAVIVTAGALLAAPAALAGEGVVIGPSAGPPVEVAPTQPVAAAPAAAPTETAQDEFPVTVEEIQMLLSRGETPRVRVTNRFGTTVTGTAIGIERNKILLDVTDEGIGIDGVLGAEVRNITSLVAIVKMSQAEREAARLATERYLAGVATTQPVPGMPNLPDPSLPGGVEEPVTPLEEVAGAIEGAEPEQNLLEIYPPAEGWGPERVAEITNKAIVLHIAPVGKDRAFLQDYDMWRAEYNNARTAQLEALAQMQAAGQPVPEGFLILPELPPLPALEGAPSEPVGDTSEQAPSPAPTGR